MPLMTGPQLLARTRRLTDDQVTPYYVDDDEMYLWLSEAERALAVAGRLLRVIKNYSVASDTRWLRLGDSPEILEFRTATLVDSNDNRYSLKLLGTMDTLNLPIRDLEDDFGYISLTDQLNTGRPLSLTFGKRAGYVELSPVANAAYTIETSQIVYPSDQISSSSPPTIPERHHQAIPIGAAIMVMETGEKEYLSDKFQALSAAWQRALIRASSENAVISRDASVVQFSNDLW